MTSSIEQKIEARLKKPFFTEMLVMAVSTGSNHTKYIEVVKEWSLFIRKKLEERNLINYNNQCNIRFVYRDIYIQLRRVHFLLKLL